MAGLQILSMDYPPSSNVSYLNKILFISHQNDRLIGDGAFSSFHVSFRQVITLKYPMKLCIICLEALCSRTKYVRTYRL